MCAPLNAKQDCAAAVVAPQWQQSQTQEATLCEEACHTKAGGGQPGRGRGLGDYAIATAAASCCAPNAIGVKDPFGRLAGPLDLFLPTPFPTASLSPPAPFLSICLSGQIANATQTIALLSIDKSAMYMGNVCSQIRRFYQPLFWLLSSASSSLLLLLLLLLLWLVLG